ncbi:hypothetical protein [Eoetvoesiella caeni]
MSFFLKNFIATILIGLPVAAAHTAEVSEIFNGDMLGTNQRYFESIAGIPRESYGDDHVFRIQGCNITARMGGGKVSSLYMKLTDKCRPDLTTFIAGYAPPPGRTLTAGAFIESSKSGMLTYTADCLRSCGNASAPTVYAHWQGPRAANFTEVVLEVALIDDNAIDASNVWEKHITAAVSEDYVLGTKFNCDRRFDAVANQAFKNVKVTAIAVGHGLKTPGC